MKVTLLLVAVLVLLPQSNGQSSVRYNLNTSTEVIVNTANS